MPRAPPVRRDSVERLLCFGFDGLFEDEVGLDPFAVEEGEEAAVIDVAGHVEGFVPHAVGGLAEVELDNAAGVMGDGVEEGDLGVATAAEDPVGVEAEFDVFRVGRGEHVVELARTLPELGVVVMIGEREAGGA